jgi:hypothetical protein
MDNVHDHDEIYYISNHLINCVVIYKVKKFSNLILNVGFVLLSGGLYTL